MGYEVEWHHLYEILEDYRQEVVKRYKEKLIRDDRKASGNLLNSVSADVKINGARMQVVVSLADYWEQLENGRGPSKNNSNGNLVWENICRWMEMKNIAPRATGSGKVPKLESAAYAIAQHIHKYGYMGGDKSTGRGYMELTLEELNDVYIGFIREAIEKDVSSYLKIRIYEDFSNRSTAI